jgi:hypothetical protein
MADSKDNDSHPIKEAVAQVAGIIVESQAGQPAGAITEWVVRETLTNPSVAEIYANTYLPSDERGERFPRHDVDEE